MKSLLESSQMCRHRERVIRKTATILEISRELLEKFRYLLESGLKLAYSVGITPFFWELTPFFTL